MKICRLMAISLVPILVGAAGCKRKANRTQCDEMMGRFAEFAVKERMADASVAQKQAAIAREREELRGDDRFRNCTSQVSADEARCAMAATSGAGFMKCLE